MGGLREFWPLACWRD